MELVGKWFESGRAESCEATLIANGGEYRVVTIHGNASDGLLAEVLVSDRLGNLERKLELPDGSLFATNDNDGVDDIFTGVGRDTQLIHKIESNWRWVAVALILTIATTFAFYRWGLPLITHSVAQALPHKTGELIGENTLGFLDDLFFEPSQLEQARQDEIREDFNVNLVPTHQVDKDISYTLHFRAWGEGDDAIPNALALPSGDIILTDKFVQLTVNQDEVDSVLLHEMGHVEHRHTLEMVTQSTFMAVILAVFSGDVTGAGDMGIGLGSLLVTTGYSRNFESEADEFAFEHMLKAGIDPSAFATIMDKMMRFSQDADIDENAYADAISIADESSELPNTTKDDSWADYLSTHPNTQQRILRAQRYAVCFREGISDCVSGRREVD